MGDRQDMMMMMQAPPWLEPLLSTEFFNTCPRHNDGPRNECNMFCLDCQGDGFCFCCRTSRHKDHSVIQIRKSSYHNVVRMAEIQKVLDVSGVQTYVINSARVLFLNERPQIKGTSSKGGSHFCQTCGRALLDPCRFCSLGCKLEGIKKAGDPNFNLDSKDEDDEGMREGRQGMARRLPSKEEEELREGSQLMSPPTQPSNSRRRKGIPRRAPFGP